jgi:hypothetical protein
VRPPVTSASARDTSAATRQTSPATPNGTGARPAIGKTELELLAEARQLADRDPAASLAVLEIHEQRFPHGTFEQEREVLAIEALIRLHRTDEARARGAAFAKTFPGSAHLRRIRVVLGDEPAP